jgi:hypothetical protein
VNPMDLNTVEGLAFPGVAFALFGRVVGHTMTIVLFMHVLLESQVCTFYCAFS